MGKEYHIMLRLDNDQVGELSDLLTDNPLFDRMVLHDEEENLEFRSSGNRGSMPDFTVIFQIDGIYICRHDSADVWQNIEDVKLFLDRHVGVYEIIDEDN